MPDVSLDIKSRDLSKPVLEQLKRNIEATNKALRDAVQANQELGKSLGSTDEAGKGLLNTLEENSAAIGQLSMVAVAAGGAITAAFGLAVRTAGSFQQSMTNAQSVAGATAEELQKLSKYAREMGRDSVFSASQAANAMYFLASAGYDTEKIMSALKGTLNLSAATMGDLAFAAKVVTANLSAFGLGAEEADRVANVFAATISSSQATLEKLATSMAYVAPVARGVGLSLENVAAILGVLYNNGLQASTAGTALRGTIAKLLKPSGDGAAVLERLGVAVNDVNGKMRPLIDIVDDLGKAGMSTADALAMFGARAGPAMIILTNAGADAVRALEARISGTGKASEMAALQIGTYQGQMRLLKSAVEELQIVIGNKLLPVLTQQATLLTNTINSVSKLAEEYPKLTDAVTKLTAAFGVLLVVGGSVGLMIAGIGRLAKPIAIVGKGIAWLGAGFKALALGATGAAVAIGTGVAGAMVYLFKTATGAISGTREELTGLESVTAVQRKNIEQIEKAVAVWNEQLEVLNRLAKDGTKYVSEFSKATGEWVVIPIGEKIKAVKGEVGLLNKQLRIAKGGFADTTPEVEKMSAAMAYMFRPLLALREALAWLAEKSDITLKSLQNLSEVDFEFLGKPDKLKTTEERLRALTEAANKAREALDLTPTKKQLGSSTRVNLPGMAGSETIRPIIFEGIDEDSLREGIKGVEEAKREFERAWEGISISMLPEEERLDAEWARINEIMKYGLERGLVTEQDVINARIAHYKAFYDRLERESLDAVLAQNKYDEEQAEKEIESLEEREERIAAHKAAEEKRYGESKAYIEALEKDLNDKRLEMLYSLSEEQMKYYDIITERQNDYATMTVEQLLLVKEAWSLAGEDIETGWTAALVAIESSSRDWLLTWIGVISEVKRSFSNFAFNMMNDIDSISDAWGTFVGELKRTFLKLIADLIAEKAMSKLLDIVTGGGGGGSSTDKGTDFWGIVKGIGQVIGGISTGNPLAIGAGGTQILGSFDVPSHDAMAKQYGWAAGMRAASFDDPFNDSRAKRAGALRASEDLGRRSARDLVEHFNTGFMDSAKGSNESSGDTSGVLSAIKEMINNPPQFILKVDGRDLYSSVERARDKYGRRNDSH